MDEQREWLKSRRKKRLRLLAVVMCASLLFTSYPEILENLSVLAAEGQETEESLCIYGFEELPEEIREQYVPVGTELEELTLPGELEAFAREASQKADSGADDGKAEDGTGSEGASGGEDASEGGNGTGEGNGGTGEGSEDQETGGGENAGTEEGGEEKNAGTEEGDGGESSDTEEGGGEENAGTGDGEGQDTRTEASEEGNDTEGTDTEEDAGNSTDGGRESVRSGEPEETTVTQETHTVTMPEYQAENVISVKTLENTQNTEPGETEELKEEEPEKEEPRKEELREAEEPEEVTETAVTVNGVTWQPEPAYDGNTEGTYIFTAILPGYTLAEGVSLPQITVNVEKICDSPIEDVVMLSDTSDETVSGLTIILNYTVYDSDNAKALDNAKAYSRSETLELFLNGTAFQPQVNERKGSNYGTVECTFSEVTGGTTWNSYKNRFRIQSGGSYAYLSFCTSFNYDPANKQIIIDIIWYAVTYHGNTDDTVYVESGNTAKRPTDPVKDGYTFMGWGKTADGGEAFDFTTPITEITDLYPVWLAEEITITFDANGGTCGTTDKTVTKGSAYGELPTPTRTGYTFKGWYTAESGGTKVTDTTIVTAAGDQTLYARWNANTYTVTYKGNGSTGGSTANSSHTYDTAKALTVNGFQRSYIVTFNHNYAGSSDTTKTAGYEFAGWNTNAAGTGTSYADGASVTNLTEVKNGTVTLYAKWTPASVNDVPVRTGYTFEGWYTDSACSGSRADRDGTYTPSDNVTLYAKWRPITYTITYHLDGGTAGAGNPESYTVQSDAITLNNPTKADYTFVGWSGTDLTGSDNKSVTIAKGSTGDREYTAHWKDETAPDKPVLQDGTTLPAGWTNAQGTIPLTLHDGVGVTELWVSIDGGAYEKIDGFTGGTGTVAYAYPVSEGEHTYQFQAKDAAGNTSDASEVFNVKLDTAKPVIGDITYENSKNVLDWIIGMATGEKRMVIHVPVTDERNDVNKNSGVEKISYTMTPTDAAGNPDSSKTVITGTADVRNGEAKITFAADFRGTIAITCTDAAGNAADGVTIGASGGGVIVEDRAPDITVQADRSPSDTQQTQPGGMDVSEEYYETAPALLVTVRDDTGNAITAGIAAVTWQLEDGTPRSVTVDRSALQAAAQVTFTISASEIPTGITTIKIHATDNAGNVTTQEITVRVKGPEKQPAAEIDYREEKLTGLVPGGKYHIGVITDGGTVPLYEEITADGEGSVPIAEGWFEKTVSIIKTGSGSETSDSTPQSLSIPAVPAKPTPTGVDVDTPGGTGKLTGLSAGTVYEVSADGGSTWETKTADESGAVTGLAPGAYTVRVKAGTSNFASEKSDLVTIGVYKVRVTFMANGETYKTFTVDYGGTLADIPDVPPKKDAADQTYVGEWCLSESGTAAVFTNITADMTVYAVYIRTYKVTLQGGTGYTLSAENGSTSPVKAGGSFTFRFALASGYEKTGSFAVKVNGTAVELSEDGVYTISGIAEDKTVTVEGVRKKSNSGGGSDKDKDKDKDKEPGGGDDSGREEGTAPQPTPPEPPKQPGTPADKPEPPKPFEQPSDTPSPSTSPADTQKPGTQPEDRTGTKPGTQEGKPGGTQPGDTGKLEGTGKPDGSGAGQSSEGETAAAPAIAENGSTVTATVDNGRIVTADEPLKTGNVKDMAGTSSTLQIGNGAVIVTVVCEEQACTAGVADTAAVANAVLKPEQIEQADSGETIEIRVDVTDISDSVPEQDRKVIEKGMEEYRKKVQGLTPGMYVDISMFMRIGAGGWNAVTATEEPVEVVIGIPEELQETDRIYYIVRAHEGGYTLMDDMDGEQDTITVSTELFSSYAIAYEEADGADTGNGKCGLCHICPTFLGICYFIWLAIFIALFLILGFLIWRSRRKQEEQENRDKK